MSQYSSAILSISFILLSAPFIYALYKEKIKVPDISKSSEEYATIKVNGIEKNTLIGICQQLGDGVAYVCVCKGKHHVWSAHDGLIISMKLYSCKYNILMLFRYFYIPIDAFRTKCKLCEDDVYICPSDDPLKEEMDHIYKYHSINGDDNVVLSIKNDENRIGIVKIKDENGLSAGGTINYSNSNRKNIYYCYFSNKFLHHEMFLERFLFIKHVQSKEIVEQIYEDASIWAESRDTDNYREHITTNMTFACILCGCIYDCFPTKDSFLRHISKCVNGSIT